MSFILSETKKMDLQRKMFLTSNRRDFSIAIFRRSSSFPICSTASIPYILPPSSPLSCCACCVTVLRKRGVHFSGSLRKKKKKRIPFQTTWTNIKDKRHESSPEMERENSQAQDYCRDTHRQIKNTTSKRTSKQRKTTPSAVAPSSSLPL